MRKATVLIALLLALCAYAAASFTVSPEQDGFSMLQNTSIVRSYLVESGDTTGIIDVSTSIGWVYDTTDYLNVTPGKAYTAQVTFSPLMLPSGDYNIMVTFAQGSDIRSVNAQVKVVKTSWAYGYLLSGESYSDVTYGNASNAQGNYSLVMIKGTDAFLMKGQKELVRDTAEIRRFYEQYYRETLYPSEFELEKLAYYVGVFNASRNAQARYSAGMGAEDACKQFTGIAYLKQVSGKDVTDVETSTQACLIVHAEDLAACGDAGIIYGTRDFGLNVYNLENNMSAYSKAMSSLVLENAADKLLEAKGYLAQARPAAIGANDTKLRWDAACRDCIGACPIIPYNITALDQAISYLSALQVKASPLKNIEAKASELLSKTNNRISQVVGKEHRAGYAKRYEQIKPIVDGLTEQVALATGNVFNPELEGKYAVMMNASATLEFIIESGDYGDIARLDSQFDATVDRFYSAKGEVEVLLSQTTGLYEEVYSVRQNASDYLIKSEMNVQQGDAIASDLEALRGRMSEADAKFTKPLSAEIAPTLKEEYAGIATDAKKIAETKPSTSIVGRMLGKFVRTEKWIALSLIGFTKPLSLPEKTVISEYAPVAVAGIIAILLAAALLLFVTTYAIKNRKHLGRVRNQIMLYSLFSAATLMVALLSVGAFYYLTLVYGGETTLNMFAFEIPKAGGAAVVIDGATAYSSQDPVATKQAMIECGSKIADALSGFNPKVYYIEGTNCEIGGGQFPYADCDREFSELPVIYVRHGQKNLVSFRTLYAVNATLEGADDWLNACHLAGALR